MSSEASLMKNDQIKILSLIFIAVLVSIVTIYILTTNYINNSEQNSESDSLFSEAKYASLLVTDSIKQFSTQLDLISNKIDGSLPGNLVSAFSHLELLSLSSLPQTSYWKSDNQPYDYNMHESGDGMISLEKPYTSYLGNKFILRGNIDQSLLFKGLHSSAIEGHLCVVSNSKVLLFCNGRNPSNSKILHALKKFGLSSNQEIKFEFNDENLAAATYQIKFPSFKHSNEWFVVVLNNVNPIVPFYEKQEYQIMGLGILALIVILVTLFKIIISSLSGRAKSASPHNTNDSVESAIDNSQQLNNQKDTRVENASTQGETDEVRKSVVQMPAELKRQYEKNKLFAKFASKALKSQDIQGALKESLPTLSYILESDWVTVSTTGIEDIRYYDTHCIFNKENRTEKFYKNIKHKVTLESDQNNPLRRVTPGQFKRDFPRLPEKFYDNTVMIFEFELSEGATGYIAFEYDGKSKLEKNKEEVLHEYAEHLFLIHKTYLQKVDLYKKANYDDLTGLPNRSSLLAKLEESWRYAIKNKQNLVLIFIDLDHFKNVNDLSGHSAGNSVLIEASQRFKKCIKGSGLLARLSGDEFCILLYENASKEKAIRIANKITELFKKPFAVKDVSHFLGTSIGIAVGPKDCNSAEHLLEKADLAMFKAKEEGRNQCIIFNDTIEQQRSLRLSLEQRLHYALDESEIDLFFQPKINLETGILEGVESLARWKQRELGFVNTDQFIKLAEESGQINEIGEWILRKACHQLMDWHSKDIPIDSISVNVSARQLASKRFAGIVEAALEETGILPHCLDLEITESAFIHDEVFLDNELTKLHQLGVKISIDDFGKEYSSLNYLKKIPFDTLKIDRAFVLDLEQDSRDREIMKVIINIGHTLGKKIIAEGIETIGQRNILRELGCDHGQGYLFCKPLPSVEFLEFATRHTHESLGTEMLDEPTIIVTAAN
jgi:diguanylate cyclase (GGDEF)-like protein